MSDGVSNGKYKKEKKYIMLIIERVGRRPSSNWMSCRIVFTFFQRFFSSYTASELSSRFPTSLTFKNNTRNWVLRQEALDS